MLIHVMYIGVQIHIIKLKKTSNVFNNVICNYFFTLYIYIPTYYIRLLFIINLKLYLLTYFV